MTEKKTTEERIIDLEHAVHDVLTDYIPHLRKSVSEIQWWMRAIGVAVVVAVLKLMFGV